MVAAAAPLTLLIAAYYVPETPSYLSMCGRDDEAAVSLQWLRGEETDVSVEWNAIQANVRRQQQQHHHHHQLNQHHQHHHQHQHRQHQPVARSSRSPGRPRSGDRGAGWPLDRRFVRPLLTTCGVMMVRHSPYCFHNNSHRWFRFGANKKDGRHERVSRLKNWESLVWRGSFLAHIKLPSLYGRFLFFHLFWACSEVLLTSVIKHVFDRHTWITV